MSDSMTKWEEMQGAKQVPDPIKHHSIPYFSDDSFQSKKWNSTNEYHVWQEAHINPTKTGYKETKGKLFYELDFEFIKQMAERMQSNKENSKYEAWNWKKPMTPKGVGDLKQALLRHIVAIMCGEIEDDHREFGHLEAIANNAMMINYQLKNNKND